MKQLAAHIFFKSILHNSENLNNFDVHLLQIQIYF